MNKHIGTIGLFLAALGLLASSTIAQNAPPEMPSGRRVKVLFLGDNGHHLPIERCRQVYSPLARQGIDLIYTDQLSDLNPATLAKYDVLLVYANIDRIMPEQETAILEFVEAGKGYAVVHCGSFCFLNSPKLTALCGARFKSHETGVFRETIAEPQHPIEKGLKPIESWDETYVHEMHNEQGRTVLGYRIEGDHKEPYTWVRQQGKGRVFYTAWGHDERTWGNENFQALLQRGIEWAAGDWALQNRVGKSPFSYSEADIALYVPNKGSVGAPKGLMQAPVGPEESIRHLVVPPGFEVKRVCSDPQIKKPICMNFDERGRLWIAETIDYPNNRADEGGHDQITICQSSANDGVMDKFTVFADKLSIPTSLLFADGGLIVNQAPDTLYLADTTGAGRANVRKVLIHGWGTSDTHSGPSNLHYGLDNWIYGTVGYSGFHGEIAGQQFSFGQGCYRFKLQSKKLADGTSDVSIAKFEFLGSTTNNTWGLGISEDNEIFGSTANYNPSWHVAIPNRYYEQAQTMASGRLEMICDTPNFWPVTERVRQVDFFGAYTAGSGHEIYTARSFPKWYWNRVAFVTEPTGHLVGQFEIQPNGASFTTRNHFNLLASDDEWTAPIAAMVGPDGAVWMIDWYAFIVQHNPTPIGLKTGAGGAYITPLRDHQHGRIYRIIWKDGTASRSFDLSKASPAELGAALKSDNLLWRLHAQRLLVERQDQSVIPALIALTADQSVDAVGLNPAAIHALWTLHGLGALDGAHPEALAATIADLKHPSAAIRKAATQVLPRTAESVGVIISRGLLNDPDALVRKSALLALAEMPATAGAGEAIFASLGANAGDQKDRWLADAAAIAAARHDAGFLKALFAAHPGAAGPATSDTPEVNLVPNPSFEEAEGNLPKTWRVRTYAGAAEHRLDAPGHTGDRCLRIKSTTGSDTSLFVDLRVEPFTDYTLSAWIKTENISGAMGALLNLHGTDIKTPAVRGTTDWRKIQIAFNSGENSQVSLNCLYGGWGESRGVAWYDDIRLTRAGSGALGGREGRVAGVVIDQYARHGPTDNVVATLAAAKNANPALALALLDHLSENWPDGVSPKLSESDVATLRAVMEAMTPAARQRLLTLVGKWGRLDLFQEQAAAVIAGLKTDVANGAIDAGARIESAKRLVSIADSGESVSFLLHQLSPKNPPDVQAGVLEALATSRSPDVGRQLVATWNQLTPTAQKLALSLLLKRGTWTAALLDGLEARNINGKDLLPQQWQTLISNPDPAVADRAKKLYGASAGATSADRAEIVKKLSHVADDPGDAARGKLVFEKNCMVCHTLDGTGGKVGPELTGVGARGKHEIVLQILDPNRNVEGTYRQWIVKTRDGDVVSGRIFAESQTNIELLDAAGQLHHIARKDVDVLKATDKGVMPEGLEAIPPRDLSDLLEYLSQSKVKR